MEQWYILVLYFAVCALLGKIIESILLIFKAKIRIKSGFLYGPFFPIYGSGALAVYFYNLSLPGLPLPLKLLSYFFIPTVIEYVASYLLERTLRLKLWDYKK